MKYWDAENKRLITAEEKEAKTNAEREAVEEKTTESEAVEDKNNPEPMMGYEYTKPGKKSRK